MSAVLEANPLARIASADVAAHVEVVAVRIAPDTGAVVVHEAVRNRVALGAPGLDAARVVAAEAGRAVVVDLDVVEGTAY